MHQIPKKSLALPCNQSAIVAASKKTIGTEVAARSSICEKGIYICKYTPSFYVAHQQYSSLKSSPYKESSIYPQARTVARHASKVVKSISVSDSTSPNRKKVLILGTQSAREKNLYSDELAKIGVSFELLSDPEQGAITKLITEIKTGTQPLSHSGQKLSEILRKMLVSRAEVTHVLLGCTELCIALNSELRSNIETDLLSRQKEGSSL